MCIRDSSTTYVNNQTVCYGTSYSINGNTYTSVGTYTDTLQTVNGCDSIVNTDLSVDPIGCTDSLACNYDSTAVCNDGSCILPDGCTDPLAYNYDPLANCDNGSCNYCQVSTIDSICSCVVCYGDTVTIYGTHLCSPMRVHLQGWSIPTNYIVSSTSNSVVWVVPNTLASFSVVSLRYVDSTGISVYTNSLGISLGVSGCTDILACNYDSTAACDDGSCAYATSSSTIDTACNAYTWNDSVYTQSGIYTHIISGGTPSGTVSSLSYCSSNPNSNFIAQASTIIEDVQLTGDNFNINNNTAGSNDFYEDYTATMYADISAGQTYTITVEANDISSAPGYYAPEAINVYIDFNIDGDFDDTGEDLGVINIPWGTWVSGTVYSFSVTVPTTGVYGATRMRVVTMSNFGAGATMGPCESPTSFSYPWFGATEDYSVVLNNPGFCDSTAILDLIIISPDTVYNNIIVCDSSVLWNDSVYTPVSYTHLTQPTIILV